VCSKWKPQHSPGPGPPSCSGKSFRIIWGHGDTRTAWINSKQLANLRKQQEILPPSRGENSGSIFIHKQRRASMPQTQGRFGSVCAIRSTGWLGLPRCRTAIRQLPLPSRLRMLCNTKRLILNSLAPRFAEARWAGGSERQAKGPPNHPRGDHCVSPVNNIGARAWQESDSATREGEQVADEPWAFPSRRRRRKGEAVLSERRLANTGGEIANGWTCMGLLRYVEPDILAAPASAATARI